MSVRPFAPVFDILTRSLAHGPAIRHTLCRSSTWPCVRLLAVGSLDPSFGQGYTARRGGAEPDRPWPYGMGGDEGVAKADGPRSQRRRPRERRGVATVASQRRPAEPVPATPGGAA